MIPRHIIVTARERPAAWLDDLARLNPGLKINFFNDSAARAFLVDHFPEETLTAYDKIRPGAFRADLFRYCALEIMGGIYSDTLIPYDRPFSDLWDLDQDRIYLLLDKNPGCIQVAIMACPANRLFMKRCRETATRQILQGYYGDSPLDITGPRMAGRCFNSYTGENAPTAGQIYPALAGDQPAIDLSYQVVASSGRYREEVAEAVVANSEKNPLFPYKLNTHRTHRDKPGYYWKAWRHRAVYGEWSGRVRALLARAKSALTGG